MAEKGKTMSYKILVGHSFTGTVNYLILIQENNENRSVGKSSFSNSYIFDEEVS